jgi:hypothetical protein
VIDPDAQLGGRRHADKSANSEQAEQPVEQLRAVEAQLYLTQLVFGAILGLSLGCLRRDAAYALLFAIIGAAVAAFRSSVLGAVVGLVTGLMLPSIAGREFEHRWPHIGFPVALFGALLGSLLGKYWRIPLSRLGSARRVHRSVDGSHTEFSEQPTDTPEAGSAVTRDRRSD